MWMHWNIKMKRNLTLSGSSFNPFSFLMEYHPVYNSALINGHVNILWIRWWCMTNNHRLCTYNCETAFYWIWKCASAAAIYVFDSDYVLVPEGLRIHFFFVPIFSLDKKLLNQCQSRVQLLIVDIIKDKRPAVWLFIIIIFSNTKLIRMSSMWRLKMSRTYSNCPR